MLLCTELGVLVGLIGVYIIAEAIVSMYLLRNIGPIIWQIGRGVRIVSGIALLLIGLYIASY